MQWLSISKILLEEMPVPHHTAYCSAINQLEEFEKERRYGSVSVRQMQLDFKKRLKIAKLVGQKPMLQCRLGGKEVNALWDTGSMISLIDRFWLKENLPEEEVVPIEEFLEGEKFTIRAANKSVIPFDGVVILWFSLGEGHDGFWVPALMSSNATSEL